MAQQTTPAKRPRGRPRKPQHIPTPKPAPPTCLLCTTPTPLEGNVSEHLLSHGYTPEMYQRVFGVCLSTDTQAAPQGIPQHAPQPQAPQALGYTNTQSGLPQHTLAALTDHMVRNPTFLASLAADVSQALISGPQRDLLSQSLSQLLVTRMTLAGDAAARLQRLNGELSQPWRIEQGGENHGPTPTKDLIGMHMSASAELRDAESLLVRAVKLALDEQKVRKEDPRQDSPLDRFRGDSEAIKAGSALSPGERETVRQLVGMIVSGAEAKQELAAIDAGEVKVAPATVTAPAQSAPTAPPQAPAKPAPVLEQPPQSPIPKPPAPSSPPVDPGVGDF